MKDISREAWAKFRGPSEKHECPPSRRGGHRHNGLQLAYGGLRGSDPARVSRVGRREPAGHRLPNGLRAAVARSAPDGENLRTRRLERRIAAANVSQPDNLTITRCARLREDCRKLGHPLAAKVHDGDRWIAATALRLGVPLVSDDGSRAPRELLTVA